jgi:hypothetical protein
MVGVSPPTEYAAHKQRTASSPSSIWSAEPAARFGRNGEDHRPPDSGEMQKIIGDAGRSVGVEHYGASADYQTLYCQLGITADAAAAARDSIHAAQHGTRPGGHPTIFAPNTGVPPTAPPEHDG